MCITIIPEHKVTEIYFIINEFFKEFDKMVRKHSLERGKTYKRNCKFTMSENEVI